MAKLHDIDVTPDEVTTQRAQSMLNTATNSIQFENVSVPWRQMYPEPQMFCSSSIKTFMTCSTYVRTINYCIQQADEDYALMY